MHSAAGAMVWRTKAAGTRQAGHVLPTCRCFTPLTHCDHGACVFGPGARRAGGLHLVLVLHDQQVWEIQAGCLDFDENLARPLGWGVGSSVQVSASTPVGLVQSQACMGCVSVDLV